ncbi:hypothetical protein BDZ85DRAFT_135457 [Elsinoe ampelina]|uniref:Uncharacterized protein n=1 Tax=Elsinoe ampelina TaxID=302913 RepID=A0A6A6G8Q3_9PEZI|nr:hypothetical protein BDZ85DRAFT_135457 [Elsinoe ampelina]
MSRRPVLSATSPFSTKTDTDGDMSRVTPPFPGLPDCSPLRHSHMSHRQGQSVSRFDTALPRPRVTVPSTASTPDVSPVKSPSGEGAPYIRSYSDPVSANTSPISPSRTPISPLTLNKALPPTPEASPPSHTRHVSVTDQPSRTTNRTEAQPSAYERSFTPPPDVVRQTPGISGTMASRSPRYSSSYNKTKVNSRTRPKSSPMPGSRSFGQRIGQSVRNMFSKNQLDETAYERIEDRHWTE